MPGADAWRKHRAHGYGHQRSRNDPMWPRARCALCY